MEQKTVTDKDVEKAVKALDQQTVSDMDAMTAEQLERVLVDAQVGMAQAKHERDENTQYKAAKSVLSDLGAGLQAVNKRQKAKITYALHVLETKGKI